MPDAIAVYVCDPQPIVIEGMRRVLAGSTDFLFAGASSALTRAVEDARRNQPHVILIDFSFGLKQIGFFLRDLGPISPRSNVVLWAAECTGRDCSRAVQIGARGVLRKTVPVETLLKCLHTVAAGQLWIDENPPRELRGIPDRGCLSRLTNREKDIMLRVCRGLRNRDIASELRITTGTVKVHLMHIFEKCGVHDRFELALCGRQLLSDVDLGQTVDETKGTEQG